MFDIDTAKETEKRKRRISFLLSILIPGLGQFMRKRVASGLFFFIVFFSIIWFVSNIWQVNYGLIGFFGGLLILYILNIIDAYKGPSKVKAPCEVKCPVGINIPLYSALISKGMFDEALEIIRDRMPLPSVCGRICHHPCETVCSLRKNNDSLAIELLKRAASDFGANKLSQIKNTKGMEKTIGIIGAGPAGLSTAYFLIRKGYFVTLYEKQKEPGGLLIYGIPEYRLPKDVVREDINFLKRLGIVIKTDVFIGEDITFSELTRKHNALLISIGNSRSTGINIEGKELNGVYNALNFLMQSNKGNKPLLKGTVAVIGGGNSGFDAARTALRCGAENVTIYYRRNESEMPGNRKEMEMVLREGIKVIYKTAPVKFLGKEKINGVEFIRTELIKVKGKNRSEIKILEGTNFITDVNMVIVATGQRPNLSFLPQEVQNRIVKDMHIIVNPITMETCIKGIFAAGDINGLEKTVVDAIEMGRRAADGIDWYLRGTGKIRKFIENLAKFDYPIQCKVTRMKSIKGKREQQKIVDKEKAVRTFGEVEMGFSREEAKKEASRCLQCNRRA